MATMHRRHTGTTALIRVVAVIPTIHGMEIHFDTADQDRIEIRFSPIETQQIKNELQNPEV